MMRDRTKQIWVSTWNPLGEEVDLIPSRSGRIKRCYLCGRKTWECSMVLTGKGALDFDHHRLYLHLLEVDVGVGEGRIQKYGFYLCTECRMVLGLIEGIVRREIVFKSVPY